MLEKFGASILNPKFGEFSNFFDNWIFALNQAHFPPVFLVIFKANGLTKYFLPNKKEFRLYGSGTTRWGSRTPGSGP